MVINLNPQIKKLLGWLFAVVMVVVGIVWFIKNPAPEHIADTNGADNYELQVITEENVVNLNYGTRGGINEKRDGFNAGGLSLSNGIKYYSKEFTGVYELYTCDILKGSSIDVTLVDFKIKSGNFKFYIVLDGKIIGEIKPDTMANFSFDEVEKLSTLQYIIAGESANFEFTTQTEW